MITISGTFTNPSGVPLPLLTILVNAVQSVPGPIGVPQDAMQTYSTNSSGAYSFTLDTGVYNIYVSGNGITQGVLLGQAVVNSSSIDTDLVTLVGTSEVPTSTIMAAIVTASQDAATTVEVGTTTTVAAGTPASVTNVGTPTALVLDFSIPQGEPSGGGGGGSTTVEVGTTTTGAPGTDAAVSNSGTDTAVVLNFTIPEGEPGADGSPGADGAAATVTVGTTTTGEAGTDASVKNSGTSSAAVLDFTIPAGEPGTDGTAATISVGTTTTGAAGSSAAVSNSGTSLAAILNFTIPQGETGIEGPSGLSSSVADGTYTNATVTVSGSTITAIASGSSSGGGVTEGDLTDGSISPEFANLTVDGAIVQSYASPSTNNTPFAQTADFFGDSIISGLTTSVPSTASLTGTLEAGVCYVLGQRVYYPGGTYTTQPSTNNYLDIDTAGVLNVSQDNNSPTDKLRLWYVGTNATAITSVSQDAASNVFSAHTAELRYAPNTDVIYTLSPTGATFSYNLSAQTTNGNPASNYFTINPTLGSNENNCAMGVYSSINGQANTIIGVCGNSPLGGDSGWLAIGPSYVGLGIVAQTDNSNRPAFTVANSTQGQYGVGHLAFTVNDTNEVWTFNNTLDDSTGNATFAGRVLQKTSVGSTTTAGAITITAAEILAGYYADGATQTAVFTFTTDTAANFLTALPEAQVGSSFKFRFFNNDQSTTGYAATLAAGSGVTISTTLPNPAIAKGAWGDFLFTFTNVTSGSAAVTVTYIGSGTI